MSSVNLELVVTAVKARIVSACSYLSANVIDGRRNFSQSFSPSAWVERMTNGVSSVYVGARLREYVVRAHLIRKAGVAQNEDAVDEALQVDAEALIDACHGKGIGTWTTLTGLTTCLASLVSRDEEPSSRQAQEAIVELVFPIYEAHT